MWILILLLLAIAIKYQFLIQNLGTSNRDKTEVDGVWVKSGIWKKLDKIDRERKIPVKMK